MTIYEVQARQRELLGDAMAIRLRAELEQVRKLDALQRIVGVVRARLGLPVAAS